MEAIIKKKLKSKMSPREKALTKDLDLFVRHARSEKPKGLIVESHPRPVSKS